MSQTSQTASFRQRAHAITPIAPPIAPPNHTSPVPEKNGSPGFWMTKSSLAPTMPPTRAAKTISYAQSTGLPSSREALRQHQAGRDEPKREHQTKGLESDGADVDFGLHCSTQARIEPVS